MSLETASFIHQLNAANPSGSDLLIQGDDHIRLIKAALKATFPNITGAVTVTQQFLNGLAAQALPIGAITLYMGDTAPAGWVLCRGQTVNRSDGNGTITAPDARGLALVGASTARPTGAQWGQETKTVTSEAGGGHTHTSTLTAAGGHNHGASTGSTALTVAQMPAHQHTMTGNPGGNSGGNIEMGSGGGTSSMSTSSQGGGEGHAHSIEAVGDHTHTATVSDHAGHGHQVTINVAQPSFSIDLIMKY